MDYPDPKNFKPFYCPYCGKELINMGYADDPHRFDYDEDEDDERAADISGKCNNQFCNQFDTEICLNSMVV